MTLHYGPSQGGAAQGGYPGAHSLSGPILPTYPEKKVHAHVYTAAGAYLRSWPDMTNQLAYTWPINGGPGSVRVDLARAWRDAGEPGEPGSLGDLQEDNLVKFYVVDQESGANGQLMYQGFIEKHEIVYPATENTVASLVPRTATFKDSYIPVATLGGAQDPMTMLFHIHAAGYMPGITLDPANPAAVGVTYSNENFSKMHLGEVIERLRRLSGANWYWRLNPDNTLTFNKWDRRAAPDHTLTTKQFSSIKFIRSKVNVKERIFVYGADKDENGLAIMPRVEAVASVPGYDQSIRARDMVFADERLRTPQSAQSTANTLLEYNRRALIENEIFIPDKSLDPENGYDVESLKPGQTLVTLAEHVYERPLYGLAHYGTDRYGGVFAALVQRPLVIAEVSYTPHWATVKLTSRPADYIEALVALSDRQLIGASS